MGDMKRYVDWRQENGQGTWLGRPRGLDNMYAQIACSQSPDRFVASAVVDGTKFHESEHGCLCEAKAAIEEAIGRAYALRMAG